MDVKSDQPRDLAHDRDGDAGRVRDAHGRAGRIREGKSGEQETRPGSPDQGHDPVTVLHVGRMDLQRQGATVRVRHRMPLAALDLLACTVASRATRLGRLHVLAVDDGSRGACLAHAALAIEHNRVVVDRMPDACVALGCKAAWTVY